MLPLNISHCLHADLHISKWCNSTPRRATVGLVCLVCSTSRISSDSHRLQFESASVPSGQSAQVRTLIGLFSLAKESVPEN